MKKILIISMVILSVLIIGEFKVNSADKNSEFLENLKNCNQYKQSYSTNSMGMNISYKIDIQGWKNDRCALNMDAHITSVNNNTNISPSLNCEFTKEQLKVIDSKVTKAVSSGENLSDATNQEFMEIVMNQNSCRIQHLDNMENFAILEN